MLHICIKTSTYIFSYVCVCVCMLTAGARPPLIGPAVCVTLGCDHVSQIGCPCYFSPSRHLLHSDCRKRKSQQRPTAAVLRTHTGVSQAGDPTEWCHGLWHGHCWWRCCGQLVQLVSYVGGFFELHKSAQRPRTTELLLSAQSIDQLFLTSLTVASTLLLKYYVSTQGIYRSYELLKQSEVVFDAFVVKVKEP